MHWRLHEALRAVDVVVPDATDRIRTAQDLLSTVERTPRRRAHDRELLQEILAAGADRVRGVGRGQVLQGSRTRAIFCPPQGDRS